MMDGQPPHVLKLGGSLLTLPSLPERMASFFAAEGPGPVVLVVGGGAAADWVRDCDARFALGEEPGHWCALHAMQLNARIITATLPRCRQVNTPEATRRAVADGTVAVVDPLDWLLRDEKCGFPVPHRWSFTSDSIAAHVAMRLASPRLTLLKSMLPGPNDDLEIAASQGIVDADFPRAARDIATVHIVNLRADLSPANRWQARPAATT